LLETGSALLIVVATLALLRWGAGRLGLGTTGGERRSLYVRESCALSARQRICIVEADGERLLVAASDGGVTLLRKLSRQPGEGAATGLVAAPEGSGAAPERSSPRRRGQRLAAVIGLGILLLAFVPGTAEAQTQNGATISLGLDGVTAPEEISGTLEIVALMTLVSVVPSILLMATCFTRIIIVLAFLRQAIGIQQLPPSQVLVGLAFFTTLFVMAPIGEEIRTAAYVPYVAKEIDAGTAIDRAAAPVRTFLLHHTREEDLDLFLELSGATAVATLEDVPATTLLPAFMISELRTAFEIGFMVYLPFLVIDLIIASMLISMGMIVLPPIVISLPFKLMLFVLMDGWNKVIGALVDGLV